MLIALSAVAALASAQQRMVDGHTVAGVSTTVVVDGKIAYTSVAGVRDLQTRQPVTAATLFRIGSITKLFTAVSVMQLVERGTLHLDDPLARFFPDYPNAAAITLRDLLMHRSGVPNYLDAAVADGRVLTPTTPAAIVAAAAKQPSDFVPGSAYEYSNTNYVLLGLVIERVTGMPLHEYYAKNIFAPAGLHDTYAGAPPVGEAVAVGYQLKTGTAPQNPGDLSWYYACGDIFSTSPDLARFDIALMNGTLLAKATLASMIAAAKPTGEGHLGYGLGISTFPLGGKLLAGHHGGLPGFESDDEMVPADGFAIATLGNDFGFITSTPLNVALSAYYPHDLATVLHEAASAAATGIPDEPALNARFCAFVRSLMAGKVDENEVTAAMVKALTPDALSGLQHTYAPYGDLKSLTLTGADRVGAYRRYHYSAAFQNATVAVTFVLDAAGKIAGMGNQ